LDCEEREQMKTYVYDYVGGLTTNWHSGGALLIITDGDPQEDWNTYRLDQIANGEDWHDNEGLTKELPTPTLVYGCSGVDKQLLIFEDSGCC
jgi:hypothetical protein